MFHYSALADTDDYWTGFPSRTYASNILSYAQDLYRIMFAMLYDILVPASALLLGHQSPYEREDQFPLKSLNGSISYISSLLCLAKSYGALPYITEAFRKMLLARREFWKEVGEWPEAWHAFAIQLQWRKLYFDTKRHILAGRWRDLTEACQILGMTREELKDTAEACAVSLAPKVNKLERDLLRLQLTTQVWHCNRVDEVASTSFFQMLKHRASDRSDHAKLNERADFIAQAIFGEWLIKHISAGEDLFTNCSYALRASISNGLNQACADLAEARTAKDATKIFGYKVTTRLSSMFKLNGRAGEARVRRILEELVGKASRIIEEAFEVRDEEQADHTVLTYRRARWEGGRGNFTYMALDESDVPWQVWDVVASEVLQPDTTKASKAFLKVLEML